MISDDALRFCAAIEKSVGLGAPPLTLELALMQAMETSPKDDDHKKALFWESRLFGLHFTHTFPSGKRHSIEEVFPGFQYINSAFGVEADEYFTVRINNSSIPSAEARFSDFLWLRTRKFEFAKRALKSYIMASRVMLANSPENAMHVVDALRRAGHLIRLLNQPVQEFLGVLQLVSSELSKLQKLGPLAQVISNSARELAKASDQADSTLLLLIQLANEQASIGGQNRLAERFLIDAAIAVTTELGRHQETTNLRRRSCESLQKEAKERSQEGGLLQMACLQEALKIAAEHGFSETLSELKQALLEASSRATQEMKTIEVEHTLPTNAIIAEIMQTVEQAKHVSPHAHLVYLALSSATWPSWAKIKEDTASLRKHYPLTALSNTTLIGSDGHSVPAPDTEEARIQFDEIQEFKQRLIFSIHIFSLIIRPHLQKTGDWSTELLLAALADGALFHGDAMTRVEPGIRAFEDGRYWEAVHVLTPQIERAIRQLGASLGADVGAFKKEYRKVQWTSLGEILATDSVRKTLENLRPNYPLQLEYVLDHPYGLNLRNDVAHGILAPGTSAQNGAWVALLVLLGLAALRTSQPTLFVRRTRGDPRSRMTRPIRRV